MEDREGEGGRELDGVGVGEQGRPELLTMACEAPGLGADYVIRPGKLPLLPLTRRLSSHRTAL